MSEPASPPRTAAAARIAALRRRSPRRRAALAAATLLAARGDRGASAAAEEIAEMFAALDLDGDGILTRAEFERGALEQVLQGKAPRHMTGEEVSSRLLHMFDQADENGDGELSLEETGFLRSIARDSMRKTTAVNIQRLQDIYDFAEAPRDHAHVAASLIAAFATHWPSDGISLSDLQMTVANVKIQNLHSGAQTGLPQPILDWVMLLVELADINRDGHLDEEERQYMIQLCTSAMGDVLPAAPIVTRSREGTEGTDWAGNAYTRHEVVPGDRDSWRRAVDEAREVWRRDGGAFWEHADEVAEDDDYFDDEDAADMIEEMDSNLDGRISFEEFLDAASSASAAKGTIEFAKEMFAIFDDDKDGHLDLYEVGQLVSAHGDGDL